MRGIPITEPDPEFYAKGLRFECTGCGECCRARGRTSWVWVTLEERRRLAQHLKVSTSAFTRKYCGKTNGFFHLRNPSADCVFLDGARCTVYAGRPGQCRTYPFWRENMNSKTWRLEVQRECPGVGRGRLHTRAQIKVKLEDERKRDSQC